MPVKANLIVALLLFGLFASMTWVQVFIFLAVAIVLYIASEILATYPRDPRMKILEEAAQSDGIEPSDVLEAYWSLYQQTKRPKSEWILMSKEQKSACFRQREELRNLFEKLPRHTQKFIMDGRKK